MTETEIANWADFARQQGTEGLVADPYKICYEFDQEQEANAFASELLLPSILLRDQLPNKIIKFADISLLANSFNVSMTMCMRRVYCNHF